ncbi:MAG TPA: cation:proton antiporter, partial [Chthonomonadaceae bacterium]|nr:cation:proton antiporter [Chthonomonadaceae bacterium]
EITLTTVVAFGSYLAAEALGVSGVMAVVTAGLVIGNYGMPTAMTPGSRLAVTAFWEYAGYVVNSLVFLLIGIEVAYVHWANQIGLTCLMVVIVLIGRAGIYPLSLLVNRLKGDIPLAWQHILFWGGLRGALSMALVLGLSPTFPQREALIAGTFGVVLFSLLVQGTTVGPLLKRLGLTRSPAENPREQRRLAGEILACEAALFELERFRRIEAHPDWAVVLLIQDYTTRRNALEATLAGLDPEHPVITDLQAHEARRRALTAEKSALLDAEHNGWLESGDWLELTRRIDAELVSLTGLRKE